MRILIHDYAGHPFQFDLSRELARRDHDVLHVYTSSSGGPKAGFEEAGTPSLRVRNIVSEAVNKEQFFRRRQQESRYGDKVTSLLSKWNPDIVVSANTPLEAQKKVIKWTESNGIPFIFWLQDILSVAAKLILAKRIGPLSYLIYLYFKAVEKKILLNSNHIIPISEDFIPILESWSVIPENITVIPNWAPIEDIPALEKHNDFSLQHQLVDKFVVLYSGTLGMKQNPGLILRVAEILRDNSDIVFVVASEGSGMEFLKQSVPTGGLENLILLPFQPYEVFPQFLASASVILTILETSAGVFSVPSKVWSGFCTSRPALLVVPKANLAARVTEAAGAGIIVSENIEENLVSAIKKVKRKGKKRQKKEKKESNR